MDLPANAGPRKIVVLFLALSVLPGFVFYYYFKRWAVVHGFIPLSRTHYLVKEEPLPSRSRRGFLRGFRHARFMLAGLVGIWLVTLVLYIAYRDIHHRMLFLLLLVLETIGVLVVAYVWLGILRVQDGLGWPELRTFSYSTKPLSAYKYVWQNPKHYGKPSWLLVSGAVLLFATIFIVVILNVIEELAGAPAQAQQLGPAPAPLGQPAAQPAPGPKGRTTPSAVALFADGPRHYLVDLQEFDVQRGPWPFAKNGGVGDDNIAIQIAGKQYPKSLGMHPPDHDKGYSCAKYRLNNRAAIFKGSAAMNESTIVTV
jgi:hypothetical protein